MALKDLLLQLSSYPEPTQQEPVEQAVRFAELLGARMSAEAMWPHLAPTLRRLAADR